MSDHRVEVPGFTRTLHIADGERICATCEGRVLMLATHGQVFGCADKTGRYIVSCHDCLGGIQQQCPHCGGWSAQRTLCRCAGRFADQARRERETEFAKFDTAQHLTIADAVAAGIEYIYFPREDGDAITELADIEEDACERQSDWPAGRPMFAWATTRRDLSLDAMAIAERACEDLHEDAMFNIGHEAVKELQAVLDAWCAKHGGFCETYFPDYSRAILVPPITSEDDAPAEVATVGEGGGRG